MNPNRPNFHQYFMAQAIAASTRSADPRTRVGAVAVDADNCVIVTGYNGLPEGVEDTSEAWDCKDELVIHAEENVVAWAAKKGRALRGATIYCTHIPCKRCARLLVQCGIKTIIYQQDNTTGYDGTWVPDSWHVLMYLGEKASAIVMRLGSDGELQAASCNIPANFIGPMLPADGAFIVGRLRASSKVFTG